MKTIAPPSPIDVVLAEYQQHLSNAAGLTPASCKAQAFYVRSFLSAQFKRNSLTLDWNEITAAVLLDYLRTERAGHSLSRLQCLASALRSFCRFLCVSGRCSMDLSGALPQVGSQEQAELPTYLSESQLEQLLNSFDRQGHAVQRDHAIVLCLSRLGLRAGEVAGLNLEDIDWRNGTLRLAKTKGRRVRHLPLPAAVGRAVAKYLKESRGKSASRAVFISLRNGGRLSSNAVSALTVTAFQRAHLTTPHPGARRLRHTVASHLVQRGASLKAVADLLGHRSLNTTQVYAKVNLPMLREIPLPWPQEVRK